MKKPHYVSEVCDCCGQSTTYILGIDHGTARIVQQIAVFIGKKGINVVHPRKEMEGKFLTSNEVGNLSRPRFHGLIATVEGNAGNYALTTKGLLFLKGHAIPKYAIISKAKGYQIGYYEPEKYVVTLSEASQGEYWEAVNYEISEGQVIRKETQQALL